jgi:hypothetical protein
MALDEYEKGLFEAIETNLAEDPKFAKVFDKDPLRRQWRPKRGHAAKPRHNWLVRLLLAVVLWRLWCRLFRWLTKPLRLFAGWYDKQSRSESKSGLANLRIFWGIGLFIGLMWFVFAIA